MPGRVRALPLGRWNVVIKGALSNWRQGFVAHAHHVNAVLRWRFGENRFLPRTEDLHIGYSFVDSRSQS